MGLMKNVDDFFKKTFLSSHKLTVSAKAASGQKLSTEHTTTSNKVTLQGGDVFGVAIQKVEFASAKNNVTVKAGLGSQLHGVDGLNASTEAVFGLDGGSPSVTVDTTYSGISSITPKVSSNVTDFVNGAANFNLELTTSPLDNVTVLGNVAMGGGKGDSGMNYGLEVGYNGDGFTGVIGAAGADPANLNLSASADIKASSDVRFLARAKYSGGELALDAGSSKQIDADTFVAFHINSNSDAQVLYTQQINKSVKLGYGGNANLGSNEGPEVFMSIAMSP